MNVKTKSRAAVVGLLRKTKLNRIAHKVYYNYFHGFNSATPELENVLETVFQKARQSGTASQGDYCEFGVFKGYAFWKAQNVAVKNQEDFKKMRFFGFDSFQGLPAIEPADQTGNNVFYRGQYSCSKEEVIRNLSAKGVDWERTFLIGGFFKDTLIDSVKHQYHLKKISIALIDCDLYASTSEVLNFIRDLIMDGTILIFDDWNCFDCDDNRGQRKAFREFLTKNRQFHAEELMSYGAYGRVFIVKIG